MNFKTLLLVTATLSTLTACGAHDHNVSGDVIGPADAKPLSEAVSGVWSSGCQVATGKNAASEETILDFDANGTMGSHSHTFSEKGCVGAETVIDSPRFNYKAQTTTTAVGQVEMQSVAPEEKAKDGDLTGYAVTALVADNGKTLGLRCRSAKYRGRNVKNPAENCTRGRQIFKRVDAKP